MRIEITYTAYFAEIDTNVWGLAVESAGRVVSFRDTEVDNVKRVQVNNLVKWERKRTLCAVAGCDDFDEYMKWLERNVESIVVDDKFLWGCEG